MKNILIAGNWKSNKTVVEAEAWLKSFTIKQERVQVVLFAPFTLLSFLKMHGGSRFELGAQDVSPFESGSYTGEVHAKQIAEFAQWVIVGHSERRKYFNEDDELLSKKTIRAKEAGLKVIYCVPDEKTVVPQGVDVVAYEPVWAIGTGKTDTPENANAVITTIKKRTPARVIYGGSVTAENVASFVSQPAIDGVLPGGASLDAKHFGRLIENASPYAS